MTAESKKFYKRSNQVKKNMCMKNAKVTAIIVIIVVAVLAAILGPIIYNAVQAAQAIENSASTDEEDMTMVNATEEGA